MPGPVVIRSFLAVLACVACVLVAGVQDAGAAESSATVLQKIHEARAKTWRWQRVMGKPRTPTRHSAERRESEAFRRWVLDRWRDRARRVKRAAKNPPHETGWRCIHRREGAWKAHTGNGYYGGLQMDRTFQRQYGARLLRRKGLAHRWTPFEQMWVAERAYRSGRGYYPWPNTARACGLL